MQTQILRKPFIAALRVAKSLLSRHYRSGAELVASTVEGGRTTLRVTDLETFVEVELGGFVSESGRIASLDVEAALVALKAGGAYAIVRHPGVIVVEGGSAIPVSKPDAELPAAPSLAVLGSNGRSVERDALARAIDATVFAVSDDPGRLALRGVLLGPIASDGLKLGLVASDGHRLCAARVAGDASNMPTLVVPVPALKAVRALLKLTPDEAGVMVSANGQLVEFTAPSWRVVARCPDVTFPAWESLFPSEAGSLVEVDAKSLCAIADRARSLCEQVKRSLPTKQKRKDFVPYVRVGYGEWRVAVALPAQGDDKPEAPVGTVAVEPGGFHGVDGECGINPRYLVEPLAALNGSARTVVLRFTSDEKQVRPIVLTVAGADWFRGLVMPARL